MAADRASAAQERLVDVIARRVVELLDADEGRDRSESAETGTDSACLTVSQVAAGYRVSRSWVYAHQRELGAMRLGEGPRAGLRFNARIVADAIAAIDRRDEPARTDRRSRATASLTCSSRPR
jgi:hypothetical protein